MYEIHTLNISLEDLRFHGAAFNPEVIYNFIELEIDEIYDLGYERGEIDNILEEYSFKTDPDLRNECLMYKNVYDILALTEYGDDGGWRLDCLSLRFTNGLLVEYGNDANFVFRIANEKLFYEYLDSILKQYGYLPAKIHTLVREYPNRTLYLNRPGLLSGVEEIKEELIK